MRRVVTFIHKPFERQNCGLKKAVTPNRFGAGRNKNQD
jgi:hypothetical protein